MTTPKNTDPRNSPAEEPALLHAKINLETAEMAWNELQRFFAQGAILVVDKSLDLIDVAYALSIDDTTKVQHWMAQQLFAAATDAQAAQWYEHNAMLWTVVVRPWVLVQDRD